MAAKANIVYAVGDNGFGEFGDGNSRQLQKVSELQWSHRINVTQIFNGCQFAIYRDDKDTFYAAGHNECGSCLQERSKGEKIEKLSVMNGLNQLKISKIFCNPFYLSWQAFIVTKENNIYGFGRNDKSQLGIGSEAYQYKICRVQWKYGNIKQIQCATCYSIILSENGSVYSTDFSLKGGNAQKTGKKNGPKTWTHIKTLTNISRIATGGQHTLCCDTNGSVFSFGDNSVGQLGLNKKKDEKKHIKPKTIPFFKKKQIMAVDVCCGDRHSLVLAKSGKVFAFGTNYTGQCGQGFANYCLATPTEIESFANNNIETIMCGSDHSAVITANQIIFMFGDNKYSQCVISAYNAKKDVPISINNFIENTFNEQIVSIHLGRYNTKLILSNNNKIKMEEKEETKTNEMEQKRQNIMTAKDEEEDSGKKKKGQWQNCKPVRSDEPGQEPESEEEKKETKTTEMEEKEPAPKYNIEIVAELVRLNVGSKKECVAASELVVNANDINCVADKVSELQNAHFTNTKQEEMDGKATGIASFEQQIIQLLNIIKKHFDFMAKQEAAVNAMIAKSGKQNINKLENAKSKALETEKKLLQSVMSITALNEFLTNIILIESLFNSQYNKQEKGKQEAARKKYAKNIAIYERKAKPICNTPSFIDLIFEAYTDLSAFKEWLKLLQSECAEKNIKILTKPEAKQKNIERAFYKTFYVYSVAFGDGGFRRLTDILRCSLLFDTFEDLYQCFTIIEELSKANGGILRCKDRFHPNRIAFGYRDLLLNIYCPQSEGTVVCEVQLHHRLFYQHKAVSHAMYKKARLFEDRNGDNLAYQYADKYLRDSVGDKQYEYGDEKESVLDGVQLLRDWKLSQYEGVLIDEEGYEDPSIWKEISVQELKEMGFKTGQAKKFVIFSAKL